MLLILMVTSWNKPSNLPDINSDHILTVGLLDHVVDGVAADKCYVDVVPRYHVGVVVVYRVYEHDVCVIRGLRKEMQELKCQKKLLLNH